MADEEIALTLDHLTSFGMMIANFARAESIFQQTLSAIHKHELGPIMILTSGLQYLGKRDALLATLRGVVIPDAHKEKIRWYLGEIHKHNPLRNNIAHSLWVKGKRPDSIKPYQLKVRGGTLNMFGHEDEEPDYTEKELRATAIELTKTLDEFALYLRANGYEALK